MDVQGWTEAEPGAQPPLARHRRDAAETAPEAPPITFRDAVREAVVGELTAEAGVLAAAADPLGLPAQVSPVHVAALFDGWNAALASLDPGRVVDWYAPGSVLLPTLSDRPRFTVAEKLDYFREFLTHRPAAMIDHRSIILHPGSAVDVGHYTFYLGASGQLLQARYTFSYGWIGGRWLITSHHSSLVPTND